MATEKLGNFISEEKKKELYSRFKNADNFIGEEKPSDNSQFLGLENLFGKKEGDDYKTFNDTRAGQFLDQNKDFLGSILGGILGGGGTTQTTYIPPPQEKKSIFQSAWFWIFIILVLILITWLIVRKK
jgi:hypothetical protein